MIDFLKELLVDLVARTILLGTRWVWNHRGKLTGWYYIASYQLTKPFKPPPKTTATLIVEVVELD